MISRNYHHIENHPVLSNLFPRENLIGGTKRDKNLSELISPTVQRSPDPTSEDTNRVDDKWICRLGSFHHYGLNTRDEIKAKSRVNFTTRAGN